MSHSWNTRSWYHAIPIGRRLIKDDDPLFQDVIRSFDTLDELAKDFFKQSASNADKLIKEAKDLANDWQTKYNEMQTQFILQQENLNALQTDYRRQIALLQSDNALAISNLGTMENEFKKKKIEIAEIRSAFKEFAKSIEGEPYEALNDTSKSIVDLMAIYRDRLKQDDEATIQEHNRQIVALQDRAMDSSIQMFRLSKDTNELKTVYSVLEIYIKVFTKIENIIGVTYTYETLLSFYKKLSSDKRLRLLSFLRRTLLRSKNTTLRTVDGMYALVLTFLLKWDDAVVFVDENDGEKFISIQVLDVPATLLTEINTIRESSSTIEEQLRSIMALLDKQSNEADVLMDAKQKQKIQWKWMDPPSKRARVEEEEAIVDDELLDAREEQVNTKKKR